MRALLRAIENTAVDADDVALERADTRPVYYKYQEKKAQESPSSLKPSLTTLLLPTFSDETQGSSSSGSDGGGS